MCASRSLLDWPRQDQSPEAPRNPPMRRLVCVVLVPAEQSQLAPSTRRAVYGQTRRADGLRVAAGGRPFGGTGMASVHRGAASRGTLGGILEACREETRAGHGDAIVLAVLNGSAPDRTFFERAEAACTDPGVLASVTDPPTLEGGLALSARDGAKLLTELDDTAAVRLHDLRRSLRVARIARSAGRSGAFEVRAKKAAARQLAAGGTETESGGTTKTRAGVAAAILGGTTALLLIGAAIAWWIRSSRTPTPQEPRARPERTPSIREPKRWPTT